MPDAKLETIDSMMSELSGVARNIIQRAFEAGFTAGDAHARQEIASLVLGGAAKIGKPEPDPSKADPQPLSRAMIENRAAPGTVKPAVEAAMSAAARGLKTDEVFQLVQKAGFRKIKQSSVRGTLHGLKMKGVVEKRGDLWFLINTNTTANNGLVSDDKGQMEMDTRPH